MKGIKEFEKEKYQKLLLEVKQNCEDSRIPLSYQEEVFLESGFNHGWKEGKQQAVKEVINKLLQEKLCKECNYFKSVVLELKKTYGVEKNGYKRIIL